ncbi:MAG: pyrimidine reductase family protein [Pseudonocardia sp.]|nr:pyrimidine reductase family protein [Pseudonocardia sp.]
MDGTTLDAADLPGLYAYPEDLARPWVRVNFVSSIDGAVSVDGVSGGLGSPADELLFGVLRRLADVVLVGAGTVRAEDYRGARKPGYGRDAPPPIAVVTGSAHLDPASRLFTDTAVPPIVLTTADADPRRRQAIAAAGADVAVLGDLAPATLLAELERRGLRKVLCEGGPGLHGDLASADAVDELCLTLAPLHAGGGSGRIARGPDGPPREMRLGSVIEDDGVLLLRYVRARGRALPATSTDVGVDPPIG